MCELPRPVSRPGRPPHTQQRPAHFFFLFFEGNQLNFYRSFFFLLSTDKKKKKYIGSLWAKGKKNEMKIMIPFCGRRDMEEIYHQSRVCCVSLEVLATISFVRCR
jgi:hypothetical protein